VSALRIALLDHSEGAYSRELEGALRAAGHAPRLIGPRSAGPIETLLGRRGFTPALSHTPRATFELLHGEFDLAHAFTAPDAAAALAWRRVRGRPAVFTCTEMLDRGTVADRRLRLWSLTRAIEDADAVAAATDGIGQSFDRWFACSPVVVPGGDAGAYERLYRAQLQKTGVSI
jgi:hypothetical protein